MGDGVNRRIIVFLISTSLYMRYKIKFKLIFLFTQFIRIYIFSVCILKSCAASFASINGRINCRLLVSISSSIKGDGGGDVVSVFKSLIICFFFALAFFFSESIKIDGMNHFGF